MKRIVGLMVLIAALMVPAVGFAATDYGSSPDDGTAKLIFAIVLLGIGVSIGALVKSRKNETIIFANYTDILMSVCAVFAPLIIGLISHIFVGGASIVMTITFVVLFAAIAKATYLYNKDKGVVAFLLAIVSFVVLLVAIWFGVNREQRSYESDSDHWLKQTGRMVAGASAVSGIFLFLAKLGLNRPGFVSLAEYINGQQASEQPE